MKSCRILSSLKSGSTDLRTPSFVKNVKPLSAFVVPNPFKVSSCWLQSRIKMGLITCTQLIELIFTYLLRCPFQNNKKKQKHVVSRGHVL